MKKRHLIGGILIFAFAAYSMLTFSSALTPYVSFAQAKTARNTVQVQGVLVPENITATDNGRTLKFLLRDEAGEELAVVYSGTKPDGFEQATSVVAIGKYRDSQFQAGKLLIKCPSKYRGSVKKT